VIFDEHNAVFFHIGKTGGHSIEQSILPESRDYKVFEKTLIYGLKKGVMTQHARPRYVLKMRPEVKDYYWFTFVRNPWDRMVSAYCYLKPMHDKKYGSFEGWIGHIEKTQRLKGFPEGSHYLSQVSYLDDDRPMDFVGRFENIKSDWNKICRNLGMGSIELKNTNISRLRNKMDYKEFYDNTTKEIISSMYREDIDRFEYEF